MKILVSGHRCHDFLPELVADGFKKLGHETAVFYDNAPNWRETASKIFMRTPFRSLARRYGDDYGDLVEKNFVSAVDSFKPEFIFVCGGVRFYHDVIKKIRERDKIKIANFVVDDPAGSHRTHLYDLGAYDEIFVIDKSWMPPIEFFNPGHVHYLPHAGDHLNFSYLNKERDIDIAFGGSVALRMPNAPSGYLRAQILNSLTEAGFKVSIRGNGVTETFKEFPALRRAEYTNTTVTHAELNEFYNRSKIVLGIDSPQLKAGCAPRIFDVSLAGSFQLTQFETVVPELFPGGEVKTYRNIKELLELARFYLEHDKEREKLGEAAHEWAVKHHTFESRARKILEICRL